MPRTRRWTDEQLADAVASSTTMAEVCRRIGILPGRYDTVRRHIDRIGVDGSHLSGIVQKRGYRRTWTDADLTAAVREASTMSEVMAKLGYRPSGGMHRYLVARIRQLELDTSHFLGRGWARGQRLTGRRTVALSDALVMGSTYPSSLLRRRLIAEGIKDATCEECGLTRWRGRPLPLTLDHVNGDHTDNRLENLRILCPNCHALTKTWCGRKNQPAYSNWQRDSV